VKEPRVSVIIPTHNHGRFLGEALDSVLSQTFRDFEVLVVDDGSTDETRALVASYGPRVRYRFQPHGGVASARNVGLRETSAPYIAFLDADDTWAPEKLDLQVAYLDAHPHDGVVFTSYMTTDEAGNLLTMEPKRFPYVQSPFEAMLIWPYGCMHVAMVRRTCLQRVGNFDETLIMAEDWDLWLRLAQHYGVANLNQPLARYRQSLGSTSRGPRRRQAPMMFRRVVDKLFADPARLAGLSRDTAERLRRRAYGSLEITVALMLLGSPWGHLLRAARISPAVLWCRRRAVVFLMLHRFVWRG
jgi:glycosyltransferase involved in cell wall biosynthesis